MRDWKPRDGAHSIRFLEAVVKANKQDKSVRVAALVVAAKAAIEVYRDHESKKGSQATGKFVYIGQGIGTVINAQVLALVPKMEETGMELPE